MAEEANPPSPVAPESYEGHTEVAHGFGAASKVRHLVTTCTRCGQPSPLGTATCPRCGAPLTPPTPGYGMAQGDAGTPEWLRSLQTGAQGSGAAPGPMGDWGAAPGGGAAPVQGSFSVGSLLSEDALPDWLMAAGEPASYGSNQPGWGAPPPGAPNGAPWSPPAGAPPTNEWAQPSAGAFGPSWGAQPSGQAPGQWPPSPVPYGANNANGYAGAPGVGAGHGAGALFDESALPDWLQAAATGQPLPSQPAPRQPMGGFAPASPPAAYGAPAPQAAPRTPSAFPGIESVGWQNRPPTAMQSAPADGGMAAHSLLDASALPAWLGGPPTGHGPAAPTPALGGDGMAANSLVDERSLPAWLRQQPNTPANPEPAPGAVSQWLAAPVTDEPLPSWLSQVYTSAAVPRLEAGPSPAAPWSAPAPGGAAAGQLVDESALPDWLRAQAGPGMNMPASPGIAPFASAPSPSAPFGGAIFGAASPPAAPAGSWGGNAWGGVMDAPSPGAFATEQPPTSGAFSASDLIDPNALPPWARQERAPAEPVFNSSTGWSTHEPAVAAPAGGAFAWPPAAQAPNAGFGAGNAFPPAFGGDDRAQITGSWNPGGFNPAASLVDESNLPAWLRPAGAPADVRASGAQAGEWHHAGSQPSMVTGSSAWAGRSGQVAVIPDDELPPWLRGNAGGGAGQARGEQRGGLPGAAPARGPVSPGVPGNWGAPPQEAEWPAPPGSQPDGHYADRFADERPGNSGVFSYAYDYANDPDFGDFDVPPPPAPEADEPGGKERKRRFGRK